MGGEPSMLRSFDLQITKPWPARQVGAVLRAKTKGKLADNTCQRLVDVL